MTHTKLRLMIALSLLGAAALIAGATYLGHWLGSRQGAKLDSIGADLPDFAGQPPEGPPPAGPAPAEAPGVPVPPPLFVAPAPFEGDETAAEFAAAASTMGLHSYVIEVDLPWEGTQEAADTAFAAMEAILEADGQARFLLSASLMPPEDWLEEQEAAIGGTAYPAPDSRAWRTAGAEALVQTMEGLAGNEPRVLGFILRAYEDGLWRLPQAYRDSEVCLTAFRAWLQDAYGDGETFAEAWGDEITLEDAEVPDAPDGDALFLSPDADRAVLDFRQFLDEAAADAADYFASVVREGAGGGLRALLPISPHAEPDGGEVTLELALQGPADGVVLPVAREPGAATLFTHALDSPLPRGKICLLAVDAAGTGEDASALAARAYGAALAHGAGVVWQGAAPASLSAEGRSELFRRMAAGYQKARPAKAPAGEALRWLGPSSAGARTPSLCVVVDERSLNYTAAAGEAYHAFLEAAYASAVRAGVSTTYALLDDVVRGRVSARAYLFAGLWALDGDGREALHERLAGQQASALWLYAPGYAAGGELSAAGVAATTGMPIAALEEPETGGSVYAIEGRWVTQEQGFQGIAGLPALFHVEEDGPDVLARYAESERVSVAMQVMDAGWKSVFIGESRAPAELLAEVLYILGEHQHFRNASAPLADPMHVGGGVVSVYAAEAGQRVIDFGRMRRAVDLLDPNTGWPRTESVTVGFEANDTRVFHLTEPESSVGTVDSGSPVS